MRTLVILAGGRSSRLGRPKALVEVDGEPLLARVARRASGVAGEIVVVGPESVARHAGVEARVVRDTAEGQGPLRGLEAGLAAASFAVVIALACDMPFVDVVALRALAAAIDGHDAAVPRHEHGVEPLHAAYRREECLEGVRAALACGERRADGFHGRVDTVYVEGLDPRSWWNVNSPEDLETLHQRETGSGDPPPSR